MRLRGLVAAVFRTPTEALIVGDLVSGTVLGAAWFLVGAVLTSRWRDRSLLWLYLLASAGIAAALMLGQRVVAVGMASLLSVVVSLLWEL